MAHGLGGSPASTSELCCGLEAVELKEGNDDVVESWSFFKDPRVSRRSFSKPTCDEEPTEDDEVNIPQPQAPNKQQRQGVFVDAEGMKEKIRNNLYKKTYNVADFYSEEGIFQAIARHPRFENVGLGVIALNARWIAVDTDYNTEANQSKPWAFVFPLMNHVFCTFFTVEWLTRFLAFQYKRNCLRDMWFVLDSLLVVFGALETWALPIFLELSGDGGSAEGQAEGDSSTLRLLRLMRLCRVARVARLLRVVPELMILIRGVTAAMRSVFFTLFLLVVAIYGFAITITQLAVGTAVGGTYFVTVPDSMYTLLVRGTLLDGVHELMTDLRAESPIVTFIFLIFILVAAVTIMNMLIGVLCEVVGAVAAAEKEEMAIAFVKERLRGIVAGLDADSDSHISRMEFMGLLENPTAVKALQDVGVDAVGLIDCVDIIFESDTCESNERMSFCRFLEVVLDLRGSRASTVNDIVTLRKYMRNVSMKMSEGLEDVTLRLAAIEDKLTVLAGGSVRRSGSRSIPSSPKLGAVQSAKSFGGESQEGSSLDAFKDMSDLDFDAVKRKSTTAERPWNRLQDRRTMDDGDFDIRRAAAKLESDLADRFETFRGCLREFARPRQPAGMSVGEKPPSRGGEGDVRSEALAKGRAANAAASLDCQVTDIDSPHVITVQPKARCKSGDLDTSTFTGIQPVAPISRVPSLSQKGERTGAWQEPGDSLHLALPGVPGDS